jgi:hypothetical protein
MLKDEVFQHLFDTGINLSREYFLDAGQISFDKVTLVRFRVFNSSP